MPDVRVTVNGHEALVPAGTIVAAAIALADVTVNRHSVGGEPRAPLCGMGICYECRVTIDDQPHQLGCQILCQDGMPVVTT